MAWLPNPPADNPTYDILARTETDSAELVHPIKLLPPPDPNATPAAPDTIMRLTPPRWATLIGPAAYASDTERVVTGYALTGGTQRWFLLPNTPVLVVGRKGTDLYLQLDSSQTIRVESKDVKLDSSSAAPVVVAPKLLASRFTIKKTNAEYTDIIIPVTSQPAHYVDENGSVMTLTLYGVKGPARKQKPVRVTGAGYVDSVRATDTGTQMQYTIKLRGPIFGYQAFWEKGKFTFRVRKPPVIDPANPLKGLTITIDPGHPPIGATGPTGLWEPEVTLPVGLKARELLQAKGVNVVMTRTTPDPVDLNLRETISRRANAHAFVSFHLNAVPDGQNPVRAQGTAVYHYYPHSQPLAAAILAGAIPQLGLPNNGVKRENFAVIRGTWMPSVLVEGAFIIMPDQEAALRTPEYQARYAQGIVDGLEAYFRSLASQEK
jgi:N-acetylmuramoyl-L-alanine amidase